MRRRASRNPVRVGLRHTSTSRSSPASASTPSAAGTCAPPTLNGAALPTAAGTDVSAGDVLGGCADGETLRVIHAPTNSLIYETEFS